MKRDVQFGPEQLDRLLALLRESGMFIGEGSEKEANFWREQLVTGLPVALEIQCRGNTAELTYKRLKK